MIEITETVLTIILLMCCCYFFIKIFPIIFNNKNQKNRYALVIRESLPYFLQFTFIFFIAMIIRALFEYLATHA